MPRVYGSCSVKLQLSKVREHRHNQRSHGSKFPEDVYAEFSNLVSLGPRFQKFLLKSSSRRSI